MMKLPGVRHVVSALLIFAILCAVFRPSVLVSMVTASGNKWAKELEGPDTTSAAVPVAAPVSVGAGPVALAQAHGEVWGWCTEPLPSPDDGGALNQLGCDGWTRTDGSLLLTVIGAERMSAWVTSQPSSSPAAAPVDQPSGQPSSGGTVSWMWTLIKVLFLGAVGLGIVSVIVRKVAQLRNRRGPAVGRESYTTSDGLKVVYPSVEASGTSPAMADECPDPPADVDDAADFPTPV